MYQIKRFFIFVVLVCAFGMSGFAQDKTVSAFTMPSARNAGMGGLHLTKTDGVGALLNNPAGLVGKKEISVFEISASLMGLVNQLDYLADSAYDMIDSSESLKYGDIYNNLFDSEGRMYYDASLGGPLSLAFIRDGFGIGFFSGASGKFAVNNGSIKGLIDLTFQMNAGYGFRVLNAGKHTLDIGIGGKSFFRTSYEAKASVGDLASIEDISMPLVGTQGMGLDLAVQYQYNEKLGLALACTNLFSYARIMDLSDISSYAESDYEAFDDITASVYRDLSFGMHYQLISGNVFDLTLMMDYRDILDLFSDLPRNPILNVGIGAELGIYDRMFFRLGVTDALPSAGIGFDLWVFKFDLAIRGKELGLDPGVQPVYCLDASMMFRW